MVVDVIVNAIILLASELLLLLWKAHELVGMPQQHRVLEGLKLVDDAEENALGLLTVNHLLRLRLNKIGERADELRFKNDQKALLLGAVALDCKLPSLVVGALLWLWRAHNVDFIAKAKII